MKAYELGIASVVAVGAGAALGAWLRWYLGVHLNPMHSGFPLGTWVSNLLGGYLVGIAVAVFAQQPDISYETRLFVITGFLGGLTTFSTFSAETVNLLLRAQYTWALINSGAHLFGSLLMTGLGMATVRIVARA